MENKTHMQSLLIKIGNNGKQNAHATSAYKNRKLSKTHMQSLLIKEIGNYLRHTCIAISAYIRKRILFKLHIQYGCERYRKLLKKRILNC